MLHAIDIKIKDLLSITDEFVFPAYYSHTDKLMWKISNVYTSLNSETLVLCAVDEGIERAVEIAIEALTEKREAYYSAEPDTAPNLQP